MLIKWIAIAFRAVSKSLLDTLKWSFLSTFQRPILPLLFSANPTIVIAIATLMTLAMEIHFTHFYMKQTKRFSRPN